MIFGILHSVNSPHERLPIFSAFLQLTFLESTRLLLKPERSPDITSHKKMVRNYPPEI